MWLSPTSPGSYIQLRDSILARHLRSIANRHMTGKDGDTTESKTKAQKEHRRAQVRKAQMQVYFHLRFVEKRSAFALKVY